MSSALAATEVFRKALTPEIAKYRLAGDWLFLGQAAQHGGIVYTPQRLNYFRQHAQTSRAETKIVRETAEHASVQLRLSKLTGQPEIEQLDAVKYQLDRLRRDPALIDPVLRELRRLDPASGEILQALIEQFISDEDPRDVLNAALVAKRPHPQAYDLI